MYGKIDVQQHNGPNYNDQVEKRLRKWQCTCWSQEVCLQALTAVTGIIENSCLNF